MALRTYNVEIKVTILQTLPQVELFIDDQLRCIVYEHE